MTLTQLRYFLALSERLHFKQTAELLYISQPSLTQHISKLEKELGVELFTRGSDGLALTPAGIVMQREVRGILEKIDFLDNSIKNSEKFNSAPSVFVIAVNEYTFVHEPVYSEAYVSAIQELMQAYPMTEIRTESISPGKDYFRRINEGTLDLLVGIPEKRSAVNLDSIQYGSQPQFLAVPGNIQLTPSGNKKRIVEYLNNTDLFMLDVANHRLEMQALDYLSKKGIETNIKFVPSISQLTLAVRLGKGAAIIPGHRIMPELSGDIKFVPLDGMEFRRYLVWNKKTTNPLVSRFVERFTAEIEHQKALHLMPDAELLKNRIYKW